MDEIKSCLRVITNPKDAKPGEFKQALARLDEIVREQQQNLHPELRHSLENRNYQKAVIWLGDEKVLTKEIFHTYADGQVSHNDWLQFKFSSIDDDAARYIVNNWSYVVEEDWWGDGDEVNLNGLKTLSSSAAKILAEYEGELQLNGLTELTTQLARALSKFRGEMLQINGIKSLNEDTAYQLAKYKGGEIYLNGVTELSDSTAEALSLYSGYLSLEGLANVSATTAKAFARKDPIIVTKGGSSEETYTVSRVSISASKELEEKMADYQEIIDLEDLPKLTKLSEEIALVFGQLDFHEVGCLSLDGLTEISSSQAKKISLYEGQGLSLDGLNTLNEDVADALSNFEGGELYLNGLTELNESVAQALSKYECSELSLESITELSDPAALSLSKFRGDSLSLGLASVSDKVALSLSRFNGESLFLGVTEISDAAAGSLAGFEGNDLGLELTDLSEKASANLSKFRGDNLWLTGLTRVSDEVAQNLGGFPGCIHFGNDSLTNQVAKYRADDDDEEDDWEDEDDEDKYDDDEDEE